MDDLLAWVIKVIQVVVLGGSSCHEKDDGIAKSDSFSRLCSTVITADHSAGIEGENWDEKCRFACEAILFERFRVSGRSRRAERDGFSPVSRGHKVDLT